MKRKISEVKNTKNSKNKRRKTEKKTKEVEVQTDEMKDYPFEQFDLNSICEMFDKMSKKKVDVTPKSLYKKKKRFKEQLDDEILIDTRCLEEEGAWDNFLIDNHSFPFTSGCKWTPNHPSKTISKNIKVLSAESHCKFGGTYEIELKDEKRIIKGIPSWEITCKGQNKKNKKKLFDINDWYLQSSLLLDYNLVCGMISQVEDFSYYGMTGYPNTEEFAEERIKNKVEFEKDKKNIEETKEHFSDFYNEIIKRKIDYQKVLLKTDPNERISEVIPYYGYAFRTHQTFLVHYLKNAVKFPKKVIWKNSGFPEGEEIEITSVHVNNYLGPVFKLANGVVVLHCDIYPLENDTDIKFKNALSDVKIYFKNCQIFQRWKMDLLVYDFDSLLSRMTTHKSYAY